METSLQTKIQKIITNISTNKIKIIIDEEPDDTEHTYAIVQITHCLSVGAYDTAIETSIEIIEKEIHKYNSIYTNTINDLSKSLLANCQFDLFLEINSLNEKAIIEECGPKHFLFKTDWKETVWRKKIVNSINIYLNQNNTRDLEKTIKYILNDPLLKLHIDEKKLQNTANSIRLKHIELCKKYNLDTSININSINPFDFN